MTVEEAVSKFNAKKKLVMGKYDELMKKAVSIEEDIRNLPSKYPNNSKQWIEEKQQILMKRLDEAKRYAAEFLKKRMEDIQKELDSVQADIKEWVNNQLEKMAQALLGA